MDFQIVYNLKYTGRTTAGKITNVRKCLDITHCKVRFDAYTKVKYKNATVNIVEIKEIYQKDRSIEKLKN